MRRLIILPPKEPPEDPVVEVDLRITAIFVIGAIAVLIALCFLGRPGA